MTFFFLWLSSISLLDFFANLLFLNSLFFPFIFLLNMTPGANSKKNADDITSNDRGEDEGIFLFFFLQSSILMHDFISFFFFFHFNPVFLPLSEESTLLCGSLFSSCLGTAVICNQDDYVNPPGRMYRHVSQYAVRKKMPFPRKLTVFFFLSFFFFLAWSQEEKVKF